MAAETLETLAVILDVLDEVGIAHMLAGSFASSHHGVPRTTADIDLVIEADDVAFERLLVALDSVRFYVPVESARREHRANGQFDVIDTRSAWKIDLIFRKDRPFSVAEFERRRSAVVAGVEVSVATAEDTILDKFERAAA